MKLTECQHCGQLLYFENMRCERCGQSAYAGAHPWVDFVETWEHSLHIVETLETAGAKLGFIHGHVREAGVPGTGTPSSLLPESV